MWGKDIPQTEKKGVHRRNIALENTSSIRIIPLTQSREYNSVAH